MTLRSGMTRLGAKGQCTTCGMKELSCFCWTNPAAMQAWAEKIRVVACFIRKKRWPEGHDPHARYKTEREQKRKKTGAKNK